MEMLYCSQCGKPFDADDLIRFGNLMVCAGCKPFYVQKLREGVATTGGMVYGGFWIRVGAAIIDGIIIGVSNTLIQLVISLLVGPTAVHKDNLAMFIGLTVLNIFISIGLDGGYATYFIGKFGATPGKMACGLKVVRSDGEKVSYGRACGRYFAKILSGLILGIGYIMVAFDDEKQGLHDRICDTRVVRKN